ncbi:nitronate monooxygenase [Xanthobacter dioxanivorans]|uniref:Nitronate monooxygenase n=1 Tax=Xanthobacter dioxanivorans TaxID=2528964 RepID=A0A974PL51_9HYPH|nr:nitronate monooxygenase family protein [Xanthobacter dioxanivorans]QRG05592.1 nitronate monooxygenase [Xanthobacter dioxanivorans]
MTKPIEPARWTDRRILDLFGIAAPILLAPMAGAGTPELAIEVARAGGLGALPGAMYTPDQLHAAIAAFRAGAPGHPLNVNFFCHAPPARDPARAMGWRTRLAPYYVEMGLDPEETPPVAGRAPFDAGLCALVEACRPEVVSFHFGLPPADLLARVKATGAKVLSSATTVAEARWLAAHGCDAVIAQGFEAGGHRGVFLSEEIAGDMPGVIARQVGTFALVPQVADAVDVPVIAAGGIADGRGVAAALMLGAAAVQVGTAYLFCPEAKIPAVHRAALETAGDENTALTNLFTGRPARGVVNKVMREVGPLSADAPAFPLAGGALVPLRQKAEAAGRGDFTSLWSGQAAGLAPRLPAFELTQQLAADALARMTRHA